MSDLENLQTEWKSMFQKELPKAATLKSLAQRNWPVHVDHCFARIILDEVIGKGTEPWIGKLKTPAYKNMSREQLADCIELGRKILEGEVDLVEYDERSLRSRGKKSKANPARGKEKWAAKEENMNGVKKAKEVSKSERGKKRQIKEEIGEEVQSEPVAKRTRTAKIE